MRSNKTVYGQELALKIYHYLQEYKMIRQYHAGYCGTGFVYQEPGILYTHFDEWDTYRAGQYYQPGEYTGIIQSFETAADFIQWLAQQSDETLSGKESGDSWYINNQRITRERLEYLLEHPQVFPTHIV